MSFRCELHPVYGAVPRDGDPVDIGDVLGLSADGVTTVQAPCAGYARLVRGTEPEAPRLLIEILPTAATEKEAGSIPAPCVSSN